MEKGVPSLKEFVCAAKRSGGSGRSYYTLVSGSVTPPALPVPSATQTCDWFIVDSDEKDRYHLMAELEGEDVYVQNYLSDAETGYQVTLNKSKVHWQLVGMDRGTLPP